MNVNRLSLILEITNIHKQIWRRVIEIWQRSIVPKVMKIKKTRHVKGGVKWKSMITFVNGMEESQINVRLYSYLSFDDLKCFECRSRLNELMKEKTQRVKSIIVNFIHTFKF